MSLSDERAHARAIGYWGCTILMAASFLSGGIGHLLQVPQVIQGITSLGYPLYFVILLGVWKVLGAFAILLPRLPLLKEWAYAGIIFELTGASVSQFAGGGDLRHIIVPLLLALLAVGSWWLRPADRRLVPA